ncbi:Uncharacterized protein TCAP_07545 [Tolypocladium capitatum]|uniref:Xylanolytic transcriptional activator regulatory domain-containing protein n=1 Tax=Tolypocladium capitatum TaxID=45235 RepID=A0A2K3PST1_9HYPO|nr:Uncharacterized protein TCAP_07545 [Tolypocladium capitatum]
MLLVKSLIPLFASLAGVVAQPGAANLTSTGCVDVSGFESCQMDATAKGSACLATARKDGSELEVVACGCANYMDNINCAASHCWNRVNECEYQEYVVDYLRYCPMVKIPLPYFPAPDDAPDACSCNLGKVFLAINSTIEQAGKCSRDVGGTDAFGNVQKIQGCDCCEVSGALSSIYGICPDTEPKLIGFSEVSKLEGLLNTPFDTCATYMSEFDCVSDLGFSHDTIHTYYKPNNLPSQTGTATLSNKPGTVTAPASGLAFTYSNAANIAQSAPRRSNQLQKFATKAMSAASAGSSSSGAQASSMAIPPVEIGSFLALQADKSEFIGSASGAFFVNTVFRAFASSCPLAPSSAAADGGDDAAPCPAAAHNYLAGAEPAQELPDDTGYGDGDGDDDDAVPFGASSLRAGRSSPSSYGIAAPGLGIPPSPAAARELVVLYFQHWHPLFPFLHGPTVFEQMDGFFGSPGAEQGQGQVQDENQSHDRIHSPDQAASTSPRSRLCRAVIFQCLFNIAASSQREQALEPSSRIQSAASLTNLVGYISSRHDTASLQTLLAVELYLTTKMSLRAASTVHGTLARTLYHAGFHRCPHRYVQMTRHVCDMRQRIFWCAYVLDRHLSQALGHPVAMVDDEIDVCVPGQPERHRPLGGAHRQETSDDRLPVDHEGSGLGRPRTRISSPARGPRSSPGDSSGEVALGHVATYSRLLGAALDLFHKSIHSRCITWDKILELTSQVHSWWNSLPLALQDVTGSSEPMLGPYFTMLYHYLILFINRPFLSLPTHRADFRSGLQSAVIASCSIMHKLRPLSDHPFLRAWPGTLSASWMAGLTIAFASLLGQYPVDKATSDLDEGLGLLASMGSNWASARRCHAALRTLRNRLTASSSGGLESCPSPTAPGVSLDRPTGSLGTNHPRPARTAAAREANSAKRRRHNGDAHVPPPNQTHQWHAPAAPDAPGIPYWQPVLEYTGPDFGFDTSQFAHQGDFQDFPSASFTPGPLDNLDGWDAYVQTFGNHFSC